MQLVKLLEGLECEIRGARDREIEQIQYDSRRVQKDDLFFCIVGYRSDGHTFAESAKEAGATCLVVERELPIEGVTQVICRDTRKAMAIISANYYGRPADKLRMAAATGTNGKTSTTYMLKSVFESQGSKVGLIGTIESVIGDRRVHAERTTPESMDLQKMLAEMCEAGCDTVVMEVSSHSLVLDRVYGIVFAGSIFTNLTQDHLDFHKDMDDYAQAKAMLFRNSAVGVVNLDDAYAQRMLEAAKGETATFAIGNQKADYIAKDIKLSPEGCRYVLSSAEFRIPIVMSIPGEFTVYNSLGTAVLCLKLGVNLLDVKRGLEAMHFVPGRFQRLDNHGQGFTVILDYCHTPDSLKSTLKTVKGFAKGRVVCVFGCGGNRDSKKRPIMGEIAGNLADFSIVTSDNPRFEKPCDIIEQILAGIEPTGAKFVTIENRREAIRYALANVQEGDVIVLAGKGHEDYQEICGVKHPFDESVIVEELMQELYPSS